MSNTWRGVLIGILCFVVLVAITVFIWAPMGYMRWSRSGEVIFATLLLITAFSALLGFGIAKRSKRVKVVSLILILVVVMSFSYGLMKLIPYLMTPVTLEYLEDTIDIKIENQAGEVLIIYVLDKEVGEVKPGAEIMSRNNLEPEELIRTSFPIVAKNIQGEIVFSKTLTWEEMGFIQERGYPSNYYPHLGVFKIVIPSLFPIVENQRNQDMTIDFFVYADKGYYSPGYEGDVPAQTTMELIGTPLRERDLLYRFEAMDPSGNVVVRYHYSFADLEKMGWKIVIPPYESGYEKFTFSKDDYAHKPGSLMDTIPQFTLEYPRIFEASNISPYTGTSSFYLTFRRDYPTVPLWEAIEIDVLKLGYTGEGGPATHIYSAITENISYPKGKSEDVRLLENRLVEMNGMSGQYTAYSYLWTRGEGFYTPVEVIIRHASFNHAGYVWILSLVSYSKNDEDAEAYFNHLLDTFRILE